MNLADQRLGEGGRNRALASHKHKPPARDDSGIAVVMKTLSQNDGATYAHVRGALRHEGVKSWNKARNLNCDWKHASDRNGFGPVRKYGYRLTYCVSIGRYARSGSSVAGGGSRWRPASSGCILALDGVLRL